MGRGGGRGCGLAAASVGFEREMRAAGGLARVGAARAGEIERRLVRYALAKTPIGRQRHRRGGRSGARRGRRCAGSCCRRGWDKRRRSSERRRGLSRRRLCPRRQLLLRAGVV